MTDLFIILTIYTLLAFLLDGAVHLLEKLYGWAGRVEERWRHPTP